MTSMLSDMLCMMASVKSFSPQYASRRAISRLKSLIMPSLPTTSPSSIIGAPLISTGINPSRREIMETS